MCTAALDALTPELFGIVMQDLGLEDIRRLRLVSKETCYRATQDRFFSYLSRKNVDLTQSGLESFAQMTSQGRRLSCLVQHLTLTGILYDFSAMGEISKRGFAGKFGRKHTIAERAAASKCLNELQQCYEDDKKYHELGEDFLLLSQSLRAIAGHERSRLHTLTLEVALYDKDTVTRKTSTRYVRPLRIKIFLTAAKTLNLVARSLRESGLRFHHLELFGRNPGLTRFNVPFDAFDQLEWTDPDRQWLSLRSVKTISLCLSDRFTGPDLEVFEWEPSSTPTYEPCDLDHELEVDVRYTTSLVRMLTLCQELEELCVTWHEMYRRNSSFGQAQKKARQLFISQLASANVVPRLRSFDLAGLSLNTDHLCGFVKDHRLTLREISLRYVFTVDSSFAPFFSLLADSETIIERIHLEELYEADRVRFLIEQRSQHTQIRGDQSDNMLVRWGEDVNEEIRYYTKRGGRTKDSGDIRRARYERKIEFGPL